ncbi:MAG TPA: TonB-dependent receptor [Vicinamibacterales bacterium]|nr:TonB-dependent receptor [Vicinamibacterales bacterium]
MIAILLVLALAQSPPAAETIAGVVVDASGASVPGAAVTLTRGGATRTVTTAADGSWSADPPAGSGSVEIRVSALGFAPAVQVVTLPAPGSIRFQLRPAAIAEAISVTADTATARLAIESSVTSLDRATIATAPALRLDDQLRSVPGFSLFRRTSSAVANPTTQGVTLRGLSASGASRTLVIADDVPLNDPFGMWVYWDRIPVAALQRVDVLRGSSGDVHGNDALGGVIRLTTRTSRGAEAWLDAGSSGTGRASGYAGLSRGAWTGGAAAERLTTNGYRVVAPEVRGPADVRADSDASSAFGWLGGTRNTLQATVRGGYFEEDRGNGTPAQVNATVTRWTGATAHGFAGGGVWEARGDVSSTGYRQTFSAVAAGRATERLTSLQWVASSGGGAAVSWLRETARAQMLFAVNSRRARADLDEAAFSLAGVLGPVVRTRAKQLGTGVVAQGRFEVSPRIVVDAGARADHWRLEKLDDASGDNTLNFFSPRAGVSFHITPDRTLRVAWLTGFRTPTMNELYRGFRVGSTNTLANAALEPETSWGPEVAFTVRHDRWTARAIGYVTRLDGAIYNRTISSTPTLITRQRSNGDARTIGSELELEWRATSAVALTTAWAINDATFTSGELDGRRVPQVPRATGSIGARAQVRAFTAAGTVRVIGAQFDDDRNEFRLARGALVDVRGGWRLSRGLELFGAIENALDEEIDTGRTPIRTVGAPRIGRAGAIIRF